jgi:asparagine synthase (glutamine-hydrolysing)
VAFFVLPDCEAASHLLPGLPPGPSSGSSDSRRTVRHASGRPWLVGHWDEADLLLVRAGDNQLAVAGPTDLDPRCAEHLLSGASRVEHIDSLVGSLAGCGHVVASVGGQVRAQGSLSTARQIYHTVVGGAGVASDDAGLLRVLADAQLDVETLATRLLAPSGAPWPLLSRPVWRGIQAVPAGAWLRLNSEGGVETVRHWSAPPSDLRLQDAAQVLRQELNRAISVRVGRGAVSADLSGGLDSTALCFLVAEQGPGLTTVHVRPIDGGNRDSRFADIAAAALPRAHHLVIGADRGENLFDVPAGAGRAENEGPFLWAGGHGHVHDVSTLVAARGSRTHLVGLGGDELFGPMPAWMWSLVRSDGLRAWSVVSRRRKLNRWGLLPLIRGLADRDDFGAGLRRLAGALTDRPPGLREPDLSWSGALRMPPWATSGAVDAVRTRLCEAASTEPLAPDRTQHQLLASIVFEGSIVRQVGALSADYGVSWAAPFLDDRVVEAAMRLRPADRTGLAMMKPLLSQAVPEMPSAVRNRKDKGEFSAELHEGLRRNKSALLALCDDSALAGLGLIDPDRLRAMLRDPGPLASDLAAFENTLAIESWVRRTAGPVVPYGAADQPGHHLKEAVDARTGS